MQQLKKIYIFSKITVKNNFWGHDYFLGNGVSDDKNEYVTWNIERDLTAKNCILVDFSHHWYLYVMNAEHEFAASDRNYGPQ